MHWDFRAGAPDGSLVPLDERQQGRVVDYEQALTTALAVDIADPRFSGFRVRSSMGGVPAGNVEYGFCQALHSEEFAGAAFRSVSGSGGAPVFGLAGEAGRVPTPCGNCRDYLLDTFGPDLEMVSGHGDGGIATVMSLRQYLFDEYRPHSVYRDLQYEIEKTLACSGFEYDPYSPLDVHPDRRYLAALYSREGPHYGALDVACDYHPIYPLQDAIRAARHELVYSLSGVLIVGQDGERPPHVMYRDRQHLFEYNLLDELVTGRAWDPPVYLVSTQGWRVAHVWMTSVKKWLPRPFSPRNFADMERLTAYAKAKAGIV